MRQMEFAICMSFATTLSLTGPALATDLCVFDLDPPEPHYVMGTLVTPQSNDLVTADCDKTVDEVRADIAKAEAEKEARAKAEAQAKAHQQSTSDADVEAWTRAWAARQAAGLTPDTDGQREDPQPGTAPLHGADLFTDWEQHRGKRVIVRGYAYAADEVSALFDADGISFSLDVASADRESLRWLLKNCSGYRQANCTDITLTVVPRGPKGGEFGFGMGDLAGAKLVE